MKKNSPSQSLPELEVLEESTVLDWLHKNSSNLAYAFVALIALFILGYWFFYHKAVKYEEDYFSADNAMAKIQLPIVSEQDSATNSQALEKLTQIIDRHPELQAKFDGLIAQALIQQGKIDQAIPFAERNLQRVKPDNLPFYSDYANTTLAIAQNHSDQALNSALQLETQMENTGKEEQATKTARTFGDTLYAFNTMRIAMLQQKAGQNKEEMITWDKLTQSVNGTNRIISDKNSVEVVIAHFNDSGVSLPNYIEAQKLKKQ